MTSFEYLQIDGHDIPYGPTREDRVNQRLTEANIKTMLVDMKNLTLRDSLSVAKIVMSRLSEDDIVRIIDIIYDTDRISAAELNITVGRQPVRDPREFDQWVPTIVGIRNNRLHHGSDSSNYMVKENPSLKEGVNNT